MLLRRIFLLLVVIFVAGVLLIPAPVHAASATHANAHAHTQGYTRACTQARRMANPWSGAWRLDNRLGEPAQARSR
jgi:hypothetical protein